MLALFKNHKVIFSIISLAILSALIAVVLIVFKPSSPSENVANSSIGATIQKMVPQNKLVSLMVAPATDKWWTLINDETPTLGLVKIKLSDIPDPVKNLGWAVTYGNNSSQLSFGLNSVYLQFDNAKKATNALQYLSKNSTGTFQAFQKENILIVIPTWASSDKDFTTTKFAQTVSDTQPLPTGSWVINFTAWAGMNNKLYSTDINKVYNETLSNLGFAFKDGSTWSGQSTDGTNWKGFFSKPMWTYKNLNPATFSKKLQATSVFIPFDPALKNVDPKDYPKDKGDIFGQQVEHQAAVLNYVSIATSKDTYGAIRSTVTGNADTPNYSKSADSVVLSMNPNAWVAYMGGRDDVPPLFNISQIDFILSKTTNAMDIVITPAPASKP